MPILTLFLNKIFHFSILLQNFVSILKKYQLFSNTTCLFGPHDSTRRNGQKTMKAASKFSLSKVKYNATSYRRKHFDRQTFSRQIIEIDSTIDKSSGCVDQISHQLNVSWLIVRRPNVCGPSVSRSNARQSNAYNSNACLSYAC